MWVNHLLQVNLDEMQKYGPIQQNLNKFAVLYNKIKCGIKWGYILHDEFFAHCLSSIGTISRMLWSANSTTVDC